MNKFWKSGLSSSSQVFRSIGTLAALIGVVLLTATPAFAHHAMGGRMPSSFFEGFLSGIAHPLIGIDHFAFVVSVGLFAVIKRQGILIPISFVLAAMMGTGMHLAAINIPGIELFVSGSILLFGILLAMKESPNTGVVVGLSTFAGLFHGYASGESIFGAEMTPLLAYLLGFTVIQLVVALSAFWIGTTALGEPNVEQQSPGKFRSAGLVVSGIGLALFASQVVSVIFPVPHG